MHFNVARTAVKQCALTGLDDIVHCCSLFVLRRSEGFLCLPKHFSNDVGTALDCICNGDFR